MVRFFRVIDTYAVPAILVSTYLVLIATSEMSRGIAVLTLFMLAGVIALWLAYRELRLHAAASRLASIGEPDELMVLAEKELDRRLLERSKVPFRIYVSIAYQLRGEWDEARRALARVDLGKLGGRTRRTWSLLHAAQRVALAGHTLRGACWRYNVGAASRRLPNEDVSHPRHRRVPVHDVQPIGHTADPGCIVV